MCGDNIELLVEALREADGFELVGAAGGSAQVFGEVEMVIGVGRFQGDGLLGGGSAAG